MYLSDIARHVQASSAADSVSPLAKSLADRLVRGITSADLASNEDLIFITQAKYLKTLGQTKALAALVSRRLHSQVQQTFGAATPLLPILWVNDAYLAYAQVAQLFAIQKRPALQHQQFAATTKDAADTFSDIHPTAIIDASVKLPKYIKIGAFCHIAAGVLLGDRVVLYPSCTIGANSRVGHDTVVYPKVTIMDECHIGNNCIIHAGAVIGADGFGFAPDAQKHWQKIPQTGRVIIGDDVEIGANTTIDRGALSDTVIGQGVKIDNQVQVAHNVTIGKHTAIAGCVGIAGSAYIGARCQIGGGAGILGHLHIADDVIISAQTTVMSSISAAGFYSGIFPLQPHRDWERTAVKVRQLGKTSSIT